MGTGTVSGGDLGWDDPESFTLGCWARPSAAPRGSQVGRAEALTINDLATVHDSDSTALGIPTIPLCEEPIHPGSEIGGEAGGRLVAEHGSAACPG
jgi:hypothetical protein